MVLISFLNVSYKYIFLLCQTQIASLCWIYFQISWQAAGKMANIKPTPCKTWKWKLTTGFLFCKSFSTHSIHQKFKPMYFPGDIQHLSGINRKSYHEFYFRCLRFLCSVTEHQWHFKTSPNLNPLLAVILH